MATWELYVNYQFRCVYCGFDGRTSDLLPDFAPLRMRGSGQLPG
jgi:hypothetical protein